MKKLFQTTDSLYLLVLRLTLAIVIFPHGAQKLLGWFGGGGFTKTLDAFDHYLNIPPTITFLVIMAEFFGMLALAFGFLTRVIALFVITIMIGAIVTVHAKWGFFMNWYSAERGEGIEYHLLVIGICIALIISGGGKWSLDKVIFNNKSNKLKAN